MRMISFFVRMINIPQWFVPGYLVTPIPKQNAFVVVGAKEIVTCGLQPSIKILFNVETHVCGCVPCRQEESWTGVPSFKSIQ